MNRQTRILLLDTSCRIGTVGLADADGVVAFARLPGQTRHAAELMPAVDTLLRERDWNADTLTDVFVTLGPGSFTGLRLGVAVARTLAWAAGARTFGIGTLPLLALNGADAEPPAAHIAVVLDAKRGQVFGACFEKQGATLNSIIQPCVEEPRAFLARCPRPLVVLGEGLAIHGEAIAACDVTILPAESWVSRAEHLFALGIADHRANNPMQAGDLVPLYVRRPEMEERWEARQRAATQAESSGPTGSSSDGKQ